MKYNTFTIAIFLIQFFYVNCGDDNFDRCLQGKYHKEKPSAEVKLHGQCSQWKDNSCCNKSTAKGIHESSLYENFSYSQCDTSEKLSEQCQFYFIQNDCFYECSPNLAPWIIKSEKGYQNETIKGVPLCLDECQNWYQNCENERLCFKKWMIRGTNDNNECLSGSKCERIKDKFTSATDFCEKIWDNSYVVVGNDKPCMKLVFDSTTENPNNEVVEKFYKSKNIEQPKKRIIGNSNITINDKISNSSANIEYSAYSIASICVLLHYLNYLLS